ncbi:hypothetical protein K2Q08_02595 [Patescibacteria group bacterium]|nr:hypothetical protein [Patescibacteria group bacterium]
MRIIWDAEKNRYFEQLPRLYAISMFLSLALGLQTKDSLGRFVDNDAALSFVSCHWYLWTGVSLVLAIRTWYRIYWVDVRAGRR